MDNISVDLVKLGGVLAYYFPVVGIVLSASLSAIVSVTEGRTQNAHTANSFVFAFAANLSVASFAMILALLPVQEYQKDLKPEAFALLSFSVAIIVLVLVAAFQIGKVKSAIWRKAALVLVIVLCLFFSLISLVASKEFRRATDNASQANKIVYKSQ